MHIFFTSPWLPAEWVQAHGLEPRGVWFAENFARQSLPLAAGVCAFANAAVHLAESRPEAAVVFTTHCDQLRRGCDAVARTASARTFLFNLPATWQTAAALQLFTAELERLGRFLVSLGGRAPAADELWQSMAAHASARQRLLEAAAWLPARPYAEALARFHWDGAVALPPLPEGHIPAISPNGARPSPGAATSQPAKAREMSPPLGLAAVAAAEDGRAPGYCRNAPLPEQPRTFPPGAIPLALLGGPLPRSQWALLDTMERAGGRIVLNATEAGERSLWTTSDPAPRSKSSLAALLEQLARHYLEHCVDVYQRPNTRLYDWLRERLRSRGVRGIVVWHYVGCDLWRAEVQSLREAFGLPVLLLDAVAAAEDSPRNVGRLEAFLEALR